MLAFCTSAIREAANGDAVLARVQAETNVTLQELTGPQEAAMTLVAVRRWYGWGVGTILDLDIGGGSFEMAIGHDEQPDVAASVPLGAGRLTRDWLPSDPPSAGSVKNLRHYIRETLGPAVKEFDGAGLPDLVAGTSKTFRPYIRRELRREDLALWTQRLSAMPASDRANLPGVSLVRAPQLLAGALVAEAAMEMFNVSSMLICPWALREGLILKRFDHLLYDSDAPVRPVGTALVQKALEPAPAVERLGSAVP
jgi:exopolyphosphatase/guanosine-5'-triphosphate,3'-diphosphate pyrophosphatase